VSKNIQSAPLPQFLRVKQVAAMFGIGVATWWRWVKNGLAPTPIKIGPGATVWPLSDLTAFAESRGMAVSAA
jgi:predicted DNA-binding transcriptional regulator AlpA